MKKEDALFSLHYAYSNINGGVMDSRLAQNWPLFVNDT